MIVRYGMEEHDVCVSRWCVASDRLSYGNLSGLKKDGQTASYSYDTMDQLIEEKTLDGQTINYTYDKRSNRTHINSQVVAKFDESNRMTEFKSQTITYDADGNRINDGRLKYSWDGLGNLTAIEEGNGTKKWQFMYDEQGRRIEKAGPSGTIRFHYDGDSNRLMAETDTAGKAIREYVYNADHILVGLKTNGTWYNYQRNYRGDIVAITDTLGNVAAKYTYDTWGKPLTSNITDSKLTGQPIRYASYYYDEDLALYYLMARYYNSEQAVFLSIDPLLDSNESIEMANGYSYVMNNPLTRIDPDGLMWRPDGYGYGYYSYGSGIRYYTSVRKITVPAKKSVPLSNLQYLIRSKSLGRGSTGRQVPRTYKEEVAMRNVLYNPNSGRILNMTKGMTDPRWRQQDGWRKMAKNVDGVEIHYLKNIKTGKFDDFKFDDKRGKKK
ncbi:hypothetical protein EVJ21_14320 [Exiguobacterium sp. SH0S2]|nr:hypothetical protein EVJ21_14320 [Exiguobacterium sp. SH0S2]